MLKGYRPFYFASLIMNLCRVVPNLESNPAIPPYAIAY